MPDTGLPRCATEVRFFPLQTLNFEGQQSEELAGPLRHFGAVRDRQLSGAPVQPQLEAVLGIRHRAQSRHRRNKKAAIHRKGKETKAADLHHGADHFAVSTCWPRLPTAFHRRPIVLD